MKKFILLLNLFVFVSCFDGAKEDKKNKNFPDEPKVMLPSWQLPWEKKIPGKADEFFNFRLLHPEWYAITIPPQKEEFRALTEYEETQILLLAFPSTYYPEGIMKSITDMAVQTLLNVEKVEVWVVSKSENAQNYFKDAVKKGGVLDEVINKRLKFLPFELNSIWTVDFGPFPILDPEKNIAFSDFRYYWDRYWDDAIPARVGYYLGITTFRAEMNWEGGNFFTDGEGTCYMTQGTFWENPGVNESDIKKILKDYLACENVVVVQPLKGEGTTHIDMFFKMADKNNVVLGYYTDEQDKTNKKILDDNEQILRSVVLKDQSKLEIYRLPMPDNTPLSGIAGKVWRTYVNSTYITPVNLWPTYSINPEKQKEALDVWKKVLPKFKHIGILSDDIITWGGAMHCISRNIPVGTFKKWVEDGKCQNSNCVAPEGGYDGKCKEDKDCTGPKLKCPCQDCKSDCKPTESKCGDITYEGCCLPDGMLLYCEGGTVQKYSCGKYENCGWNPENEYYDCGFTKEGPEGYPKDCPSECGNIPSTGKCEGNVLKWCEKYRTLQEKDCAKDGMVCLEDPQKKGVFKCLPKTCQDECSVEDRGCSDDKLSFFECKLDETTKCYKKTFTQCSEEMVCENGECVSIPKPEPEQFEIIEIKEVSELKEEEKKGGGGGWCNINYSSPDNALSLLIILCAFLSSLYLKKRRERFS